MRIDNWFEWVLWITTTLQVLMILPLVIRSARGILSTRPNQPHWRSDLAVTFLMLGIVFRGVSSVYFAYQNVTRPNIVVAFAEIFLTMTVFGVLVETTREWHGYE